MTYLLKIFSFLLLLFCTLSVWAQPVNKVWYFGNHAGLSFATSPPAPLLNGALSSDESCASFTDAQGNLLMYTDGISVYNSNHQQMPNGFGLFGHSSSTQGAIIVPKPGSATLFYIFVTETQPLSRFTYSVVDMSLQGGLGDVTTKNILLEDQMGEQLTSVQHSNGTDFWVVVHKNNSNNFYSYLVSASGVSAAPVISATGVTVLNSYVGQMKISPAGNKLAYPLNAFTYLLLCDFNATTGQVSNAEELYLPAGASTPYGTEFSASGRFLYCSATGSRHVYQWDLANNSIAGIIASRQLIGEGGMEGIGSMQLAPDGKIYVARNNSSYLAAIHNPELAGIAANYDLQAINLSPKQSRLGLPGTIQSYLFFPFNFQATNLCNSQATEFSIFSASLLTNISWDFGDPGSGSNNLSTITNPLHSYATPGLYTVTLTADYEGNPYTVTQTIQIEAPLPAVISPAGPVVMCSNAPVTLQAPINGAWQYKWFRNGFQMPGTNATLPQITTNQAGNYHVIISYSNCTDTSAAVNVTVNQGAFAAVIPPVSAMVCPGEAVNISANNNFYTNSFVWLHNGVKIDSTVTNSISATLPGTYKIVGFANGLCPDTSNNSFTLSHHPVVQALVSPAGPVSICGSGSVLLSTIPIQNGQYQWLQNGAPLPGETNTDLTVQSPGFYQLVLTVAGSPCSDTSDIVQVQFSPSAQANITSGNLTFCTGQSVNLDGTQSAGTNFQWLLNNQVIPGATSAFYSANVAGNYQLVAHYNGACPDTSVAVTVTEIQVPDAAIHTPGPVKICETMQSVIIEGNEVAGASYKWLFNGQEINGATGPNYTTENTGNYQFVVSSGNCADTSGIIEVVQGISAAAYITNDVAAAMCEGDSLILIGTVSTGANYQWLQNGAILPAGTQLQLTVHTSGSYQLIGFGTGYCTDTSEAAEVSILPLPVIGILQTAGIDCTDPYMLTATGAAFYSWSTGQEGAIIEVPSQLSEVYTVTGTDDNGCSNSRTFYFEAPNCTSPENVFIPNIITPNNDGQNDFFVITGLGNNCELSVFNRWGKSVYFSADYNNNWNGGELADGVYFYMLQNKITEQSYKGFIELLR